MSGGLQQADHWLEVAESSAQLAQQAAELAHAAGVPIDTEPCERLLRDLRSLRGPLTDAIDTVEKIRAETAEGDDEKSVETHFDQAVALALRAVATLGSVDARLEKLSGDLTQTQENMRVFKTTALRSIVFALFVITMLLCWMATGQVALVVLARKASLVT